MHGCPNRCKHCWVGRSRNSSLTEEDLRFAVESFRPLAQRVRRNVPLGKIVKKAGKQKSLRLFDEGDFIVYCLNKYCLSL